MKYIMENETKDKIRDAVIKMVDRFSALGLIDDTNHSSELQTVVSEALFSLEIVADSNLYGRGGSIFQSDLFGMVKDLVEIFDEKVSDGKSSDTEFDKLISSLQDNLSLLSENHNGKPILTLGNNKELEFSKALTQDDLEKILLEDVVEASKKNGGMNIQNPTSLKEAETNPRFDLNDWCRNISYRYFQEGPEATLDYTRLYELSHKQADDGFTDEFLRKSGAKLVELNPDLLISNVRKSVPKKQKKKILSR